MKIGFVYDMIYPFSKGGAEKRYYCLASRLAKSHEVHWVGLKMWSGPNTIVTESGITLHGTMKPPGQMYVADGRRSLLWPFWFGAVLFHWPGLRKMDVIECSSFPFFSVFSARALGFAGRIPMVTTWHEFWGEYWKEYAPRVSGVGKLIERLALSCSKRVISVSNYTADKIENAGMKASNIDVVPNGIDLEAIVKSQALPNGPDVLFIGRLIREKGVANLLEALSTGPLERMGATCWIIGRGAEEDNLKQMAQQHGLGSRVKFIPWIEESEIYGAMKSAKVLALLSEREGFGMVVLEAMACGTPVVVSQGKNSAAPELVQPGETGYVVPCEPYALSEAMASIIGSPERKSRMGARARELAECYDWDSLAERVEAIYQRTASMSN